MNDTTKEIVLIAPYEDLCNKAKELTKDTKYAGIEVIQADLDAGLAIAKDKVVKGAKIIISRGGTFSLLREALDVPMVEIKISAYDLMSSYPQLLKFNEPLAIIGYRNIISGFDLLLDFAKDVKKIEITHDSDVEALIIQCERNGIKAFAGGAVVAGICKKRHLRCFMWVSSYDSIRTAFDTGLSILQAIKKEQELFSRYHNVVDYVHDGVIATDEHHHIMILNSLAQDILDLRADEIVGNRLEDIVSFGTFADEFVASISFVEKVCSMNGVKVSLSKLPVVVDEENCGMILVFQEVVRLQSLEQKVRRQLVGKGFVARHSFSAIVYKSKAMESCMTIAGKFSKYDAPVLIQGETGVGKELFAQGMHNASKRKSNPFVAVNCAALTPSLIESELFGYADGAFTGGIKGGKAGVFEMAHRGTLFLDEVGELPLEMQGRLLRVIQEKEVVRIGGNTVIPLDVRLICATNCNLEKDVEDGHFRRDLYFRINTLHFTIPPLRSRREDIPLLAASFLERFCLQYSKNLKGFDLNAMNYLCSLDYSGNVRELRGIVEMAVILAEGNVVRINDVSFVEGNTISPVKAFSEALPPASKKTYRSLKEIETSYMEEVYEACNKSISQTCKLLKISRTTLWRKIEKPVDEK
ncbi:MAG: sigma 54-interacting transcriptional regulator [Spirochaetia bacterium]|jgi:transcriptional regulator with PAS, ATPase and Fis domain|nr:sigma 54-interacting transcriptional regulator [Spirochaetia bacterium]